MMGWNESHRGCRKEQHAGRLLYLHGRANETRTLGHEAMLQQDIQCEACLQGGPMSIEGGFGCIRSCRSSFCG